MDPKWQTRGDVYSALVQNVMSPEPGCWLLLQPDSGIPTGHAQLMAWVLHKTGFFQVSVQVSIPQWNIPQQSTSEHAQEMAWLGGGHLVGFESVP